MRYWKIATVFRFTDSVLSIPTENDPSRSAIVVPSMFETAAEYCGISYVLESMVEPYLSQY